MPSATARQLHLLRHLKSSWADPALRDDQRPLTPRGKRAGRALAAHFRDIDLHVDLVLCSPARRARDTWTAVRPGVRSDPEVRLVPGIYEASATQLLAVVADLDDTVASVLMIGHNPGVGEFAAQLDERAPGHGFPTGAFASFSVTAPWAEVTRGSAHLDHAVRPRDL
ncbi:MAG: SixA phosphatase family protein [Jatrophihabitantaceae bacterium]